jgi:hypothetical protein
VTTWTCVECGLPDPYHGDGDGIGSCDCPRCDCGECRYCADAFCCHGEACADGQRHPGWDDEDEGWDEWGDCGVRRVYLPRLPPRIVTMPVRDELL